jgi:hypothetical protein
VRNDYQAAGTAAVTGLAATAVGFLVSWHGSVEFWSGSGGARDVSGSAYFANQTVDGFFARPGFPHPVQNTLWLTVVCGVPVIAVAAVRRAHLAGPFRNIRWGMACAVTVVVFAVGPYRYLTGDDLRWNWWQQVLGTATCSSGWRCWPC